MWPVARNPAPPEAVPRHPQCCWISAAVLAAVRHRVTIPVMPGRWVAALFVMALLTACTSSHHPAPQRSTKRSTHHASITSPAVRAVAPMTARSTLTCTDGQDVRSARPLRVVLGVVALPASPMYPALQTARTGGSPRLFAKTGLFAKPGARFTVSVPAGLEPRLYVGWGSPPKSLSREVVVPACPGTAHEWLAFPGGYWIDHPACVAVVVQANSRSRSVRVGLGTPCAGQQPPQGPTQS